MVARDGGAYLEEGQVTAGEHVPPPAKLGVVFMISHSSGVSLPGLCKMASGIPTHADVVQGEARLMSSHLSSFMPSSLQNNSV